MRRTHRAGARWRRCTAAVGLLIGTVLLGGCAEPEADLPDVPGDASGHIAATPPSGTPSKPASTYARDASEDQAPGSRVGTVIRSAAPELAQLPPGQAAPWEQVPIPHRAARLAIVIDDVGWNREVGLRAIALPGPLTLAVLPGTPVGAELARAGFTAGHEIILHQPMAPIGSEDPGPGAMLANSSGADISRILAANLAAVPHRVGVSNHMGSLLTSRSDAMHQLMRSVAADRVYFLDSRTTAASVAFDAARGAAVPAVRRDVFLDNEPDAAIIEAALDAAVALAERRGHAVAIAHPRPVTLAVLERRLPSLGERVQLVPVSALVAAPNVSASIGTAGTTGTGGSE